jgi:dipeptidyl aminopeptidase/acylaminoacyl peptidase
MNAIRTTILIWCAALLLVAGTSPAHAKKSDDGLKAAFIRNGDLWIKNGDNEKQLTSGAYIRNPKWSYDSSWIAYTKGENEQEQELWLWHVQSGKSHLVSLETGRNFQWQPTKNSLAFQTKQQLHLIEADELARPEIIAQDIGNYSWMPDGSGFLASTGAKLLPDGWAPVGILRIPLSAKGNPDRFETVYVLPKQSDDFFAVGTSIFKWSANGRWIAFLATPTASLSADGNTLCILAADGAVFKKIDQMVNNEQWFNWADKGEKLAYIGGVGREATTNKQLKVVEIPASNPVSYTPKGYVDQNFTWLDYRHIMTSRAKELAEWSIDPTKRPFPYLVHVKLGTQRQKQVTPLSVTHGDYSPISLPTQRLAWIRSNRIQSNVMLAGTNSKKAFVWIENIDLGANYYEQWNWNTVLSFFVEHQVDRG